MCASNPATPISDRRFSSKRLPHAERKWTRSYGILRLPDEKLLDTRPRFIQLEEVVSFVSRANSSDMHTTHLWKIGGVVARAWSGTGHNHGKEVHDRWRREPSDFQSRRLSEFSENQQAKRCLIYMWVRVTKYSAERKENMQQVVEEQMDIGLEVATVCNTTSDSVSGRSGSIRSSTPGTRGLWIRQGSWFSAFNPSLSQPTHTW